MRLFRRLTTFCFVVLLDALPAFGGDQLIGLTIRDLAQGGQANALLNDLRSLAGVEDVEVDWPKRALQIKFGPNDELDVFQIARAIADQGLTLTQFTLEADGYVGQELDTTYFFLQSGQPFLVERNGVANTILSHTENAVRVKARVGGWRQTKQRSSSSDQALDPYLTLLSYKLPKTATR